MHAGTGPKGESTVARWWPGSQEDRQQSASAMSTMLQNEIPGKERGVVAQILVAGLIPVALAPSGPAHYELALGSL